MAGFSSAFPFSDRELSQRLERAEGRSCASFVESRAALYPSSGACWIEVAGAYAMFDTPTSPVTQTFGLGMFQTPTDADLARIETFFAERGAPVFHEVSPLAGEAMPGYLAGRGYRPIELTSILYRPIGQRAELSERPSDRVTVRQVRRDELEMFATVAAEGWSHITGLGDFMFDMGRIGAHRPDAVLFLAEIGGEVFADSGNAGILDLILALRWVRDNIEEFGGGNFGKVTRKRVDGYGREIQIGLRFVF